MRMFKIKDRYIIRQKMLSYLYSKVTYTDNDIPQLQNTKSSLKEIADKINVPYSDVYKCHHGMPDDQMTCIPDNQNKEHYVILLRDGINSAIEDYWLREGQKELNERVYDKVKWQLPMATLALAIGTFIYGIHNTKQAEEKVLNLQEEVSKLKEQIKQTTDSLSTKIYHLGKTLGETND